MKKLLVLMTVLVLTSGSLGCSARRARNWWYQGAICTPPVVGAVSPGMVTQGVVGSPCCETPMASDCCDGSSAVMSYDDGYLPGEIIESTPARPGPQ